MRYQRDRPGSPGGPADDRTLGTEFGHFFLLEQGGEVTLIDAGLSGYRDTLEPALADMGCSIDDVKAIVLTHADPDHVGFAGELQASQRNPALRPPSRQRAHPQGKIKQSEGSPLAMLAMLKHAHSRRALRHMIANGGAKQPKVPESSLSMTATSSTCQDDCE